MDVTLGNRMNVEDKRYRRRLNFAMLLVGLVVLIAELAAAYVVLYENHRVMNDAIARTANAYYVLYIKPSKLASIGFVWNPLPSLLQIPILLFAPYWRPLATVGFSGAIVTAVFAAINAGLIFRYLRKVPVHPLVALLITFLYAFNPFVFYYGFNGMSETIFFTALISSTANIILWAHDRLSGRLVTSALMLVLAFLTRYEAFPLAFAFGLVLIVIVYFMEDVPSPFKKKPPKMKFDYLVASGTMLFLPIVYAVAIWIFLNWTILGNPFYFLNSTYSNTSQSEELWSGFLAMIDSPFKSFAYALKLMLPFLPVFIVILVVRYCTRRMFRSDFLIFLLLISSLAGFHWLMLLTGSSFGWLRFFCFSLPIAIAWLPYELTQLSPKAKNRTLTAVCCALLLSGVLTNYYLGNVNLAKEEYHSLSAEDNIGNSNAQYKMAEIINKNYSDQSILLDSFTASTLILALDHPENIITNTSEEFDNAVTHPLGQEVDYIVIPNPEGIGRLDALNSTYPRAYYGAAPWLELVEDTGAHRLFRILEDEYYDTIREYGVLRPGKIPIQLTPHVEKPAEEAAQ